MTEPQAPTESPESPGSDTTPEGSEPTTTAQLDAVAERARDLAERLPAGLTQLSVAANGVRIEMSWMTAPPAAQPAVQPPAPSTVPATAPVATPATAPADEPADPHAGLTGISAPLVGTFYRAKSPDSPPFVEVGSRVEEGQTIGIVEAMKLLNEVTSTVAGTVVEMPVANGDAVEFGQVLVYVEPS